MVLTEASMRVTASYLQWFQKPYPETYPETVQIFAEPASAVPPWKVSASSKATVGP